MGKYTQGPWIAKRSELYTTTWIEDSNGKRIATTKECDQDWDNTKLMAAAPDMLEALLKVQELFIGRGNEYEEIITNAIKKATK